MFLDEFLLQLRHNPESIGFHSVMALIDSLYDFSPATFHNGAKHNTAGENSGSCKLFAFARQQGLSESETLACFGRHYREDVLLNSGADSHMNIRNFMARGWGGITFDTNPLTAKQ